MQLRLALARDFQLRLRDFALLHLLHARRQPAAKLLISVGECRYKERNSEDDQQEKTGFGTDDVADHRMPRHDDRADDEADDPSHEAGKDHEDHTQQRPERRADLVDVASEETVEENTRCVDAYADDRASDEELNRRETASANLERENEDDPDRDRRKRPPPSKPVSRLPHNLLDVVSIVAHSPRSRNRVRRGGPG